MPCKGEAQKSPLFWRFSGFFLFSQDRLFSRNSTRKPLNLIKSPIFTNAPCKTPCLYNAPSMHTVEFFYKIVPRNNFFCNFIFVIITQIIPPEDVICNVAATGVSLFARKQAKEFAL